MTVPLAPYPEERRLATVLFADIQGFTAMAEQLDFEEVSDLLKEVWRQVDTVIQTYGGYVDKHIGDAVMAVWGAPHTSEDDAERAVTAGLALHSCLADVVEESTTPEARTLQMRVGINTGLVLSGYVGLRGEYTVMGDTVNVASRLEHIAEPGTVVVSESTYRLVRGAFRVRRMSPTPVKGKTGHLQPFVIEGALPHPQHTRYRSAGGLETRMVARDAELARLNDLYRRAHLARLPTLVIVDGEAGLGKSRLLLEFTTPLEVDEPNFMLLSARGLDQASRISFFVWKSLWYSRFALSESDPPEIAREKFVRGLQTLWGRQLGPVSAVEAAHFIGHLIGLEWTSSPYLAPLKDDSQALTQRAFEFTFELLRRTCAAGPTVMLIDDLQWIDEGSLDLLEYILGPGPAALPMLILAGARSGFLEQHAWLANTAERIVLQPLPVSAEIVAAAYPSLRHLPESTRLELAQRAEGNPYFLEEMVKNLPLSRSTSSLNELLPESLQSLLQARLDSLSPEARGVALLASVVGRVFWVGAVRAAMQQTASTGMLAPTSEEMMNQGLVELMRAELAFPRAGSVFANEKEYIFKHSLLRDVAYRLLPLKYRRPYHLAVGRWLAASAGPDFAPMVAEHLEQAGAFPEASDHYDRAARQARSRGAIAETAWLQARAAELAQKPALGSGSLRRS